MPRGVVDEPALAWCRDMGVTGVVRGIATDSAASVVAVLVFVAMAMPCRGRRSVWKRLGESGQPRLRLSGLLAALGCRLGTALSIDTEDHALLGAAVSGVAMTVVLFGPVVGLAALITVVLAVRARRKARDKATQQRIERGLPEVIDLLSLVIAAGRPTVAALSDIVRRTPEPFRAELAGVLRRTAAGEPFVESARRLRGTLGSSSASLVYAITAAEIDGVPLRPALERAGDEAHRRRRARAEEAARRVPVFMLFPLVFCIFPAFCLLTVVPLLISSIADIGLPD